MNATALVNYLRLVETLLWQRAVTGTTEDEEEEFGIKLDGFWQRMSSDQREQAEAFIVERMAIVAPDELPEAEDFDPSHVHQRPRRAA